MKYFNLIIIVFFISCGSSIKGMYKGTGVINKTKFVNLSFKINENNIGKIQIDDKVIDVIVCDLKKDDKGNIEFKLNRLNRAKSCVNNFNVLYIFKGKYGNSVWSGNIHDLMNKKVGVWRVLKVD